MNRLQTLKDRAHSVLAGKPDYVDPDKWAPLIMSFQHFYGPGRRGQNARPANIPESFYRTKTVREAASITLFFIDMQFGALRDF